MSRDRFDDEIGKKIKREADASSHHRTGRSHMLGPPGTLNTATPCAACKLLRRRCAQECPFSPYFSPHEPQKFASVHKVFGASNVSKMLNDAPGSQRADAANSLVYEANVRLRHPVYGCMGAISALQHQIQCLQAELNVVRNEIVKYKFREASNNNNIIIQPPPLSLSSSSSSHQHQHQHHAASSPLPAPHAPPPPLPSTPASCSSTMYAQPIGSVADYSTISISSDQNNISYFG